MPEDKKKKRMLNLNIQSKQDNTKVATPKKQKADFRFGSEDRSTIEKHVEKRQNNDKVMFGMAMGEEYQRRSIKKELANGSVNTYGNKKGKGVLSGRLVSKKKGLDKYPIKKDKQQYKRRKKK